MGQLKTKDQRKQHFMDDLNSLMKRHGAEFEINEDFYFSSEIVVIMDCIYDDDGDLLAEPADFVLDLQPIGG